MRKMSTGWEWWVQDEYEEYIMTRMRNRSDEWEVRLKYEKDEKDEKCEKGEMYEKDEKDEKAEKAEKDEGYVFIGVQIVLIIKYLQIIVEA